MQNVGKCLGPWHCFSAEVYFLDSFLLLSFFAFTTTTFSVIFLDSRLGPEKSCPVAILTEWQEVLLALEVLLLFRNRSQKRCIISELGLGLVQAPQDKTENIVFIFSNLGP